MAKDYGEPIPAGPFIAWLNDKLEKLATDETLVLSGLEAADVPTMTILGDQLGISERAVYRYKNSLSSVGEPTDTFPRNRVEDMLDAADVRFEDVYPDIAAAEDVELEPEAFCTSCRDIVTPISGACPWCDRPVIEQVPTLMFCSRCDKMQRPAIDGACWRCGGKLKRHSPMRPCGCGCGTQIKRFDHRGRESFYIKGHAPRSLERKQDVPLGPLRGWLQQQLRDLDPIQALAHRTGLPRELVLDVLNDHIETIDAELVRRALRNAGTEGQGRGMPWRPGSVRFRELYPEAVRSKTCPTCGKAKAPHAEQCRQCAKSAGKYKSSNPSSVSPELVDQARRLRDVDGLTFAQIAERLQPRTRCANVESVKNQLRAEFRKRGWETSRIDRQAA